MGPEKRKSIKDAEFGMAGIRAADDFAAIRSRMEELRHQTGGYFAKEPPAFSLCGEGRGQTRCRRPSV
jgi:hypothetical protein